METDPIKCCPLVVVAVVNISLSPSRVPCADCLSLIKGIACEEKEHCQASRLRIDEMSDPDGDGQLAINFNEIIY